ncbi:MAG: patatin-like phospholipase family protein [Deltaproteobacteria bacterium]|nr:patatin-like phospholipase family protein [Deltaproteobacteria bacterium]MBN2672068.1 patatin-like phospholipase family protein [Deltaproteobacteria bacterium]
MLTEAIKRNPDYLKAEIVTGASAGAINTVLSMFALGAEPEDNPQNSIYYLVWNQLRFNHLLDVCSPETPPGALSSRKLLWDISRKMISFYPDKITDLDLKIGISTTRVDAEKISIPGGITIPNQQAKFVFLVEKNKDTLLRIDNHLWTKDKLTQLLLPFSADLSKNFNAIMQTAFASCGIPVVFPPQEIDYCEEKIPETDQQKNPLDCAYEDTTTGRFVDGGVVDNSPINLAYNIRNNRRASGASAENPDRMIYIYVDPEHLKYEVSAPTSDNRDPSPYNDRHTMYFGMTLSKTLPKFLSGFIASSRSSEIYSLVQHDPQARVLRTKTKFLPVSSVLHGQLGFFEQDILKFDYYLGMRDAAQFIQTDLSAAVAEVFQGAFNGEIQLPVSESAGWAPYLCMKAVFDGEGNRTVCDFTNAERQKNDPASAGDVSPFTVDPIDPHNFKILMQVSIDRL